MNGILDFINGQGLKSEAELRNLHNRRRTTAPVSPGGFFAPAIRDGAISPFPFARLRGIRAHVQGASLKTRMPNLRWGYEPPESGRLVTVRAPAIVIASEGARA